MQKLFLFFTCAYLLFSCGGTSECDCAELYQQKDSLYYLPSYGDEKINKLVAQYFNAENKIAQLKNMKDSLEQSYETSTAGLWETGRNGANYHDSVRVLSAEIKSQKIQEPDTHIVKKHFRLSEYYLQEGNFDEALQSSLNAFRIAEKINAHKFIFRAYISIGNIYLWKREYAKSLEYAMRALKISEQEGTLYHRFLALMLMSEIYLFNEDRQRSRLYFEQAKEIQNKINTKDTWFYVEMREIDMHIHDRDFNKAIQRATSVYEREFSNLKSDYQWSLLQRLYDFISSNKPVKHDKEILQKLIELEPENENYKTRLRIANGEISKEEGSQIMIIADSVRARKYTERIMKLETLKKENTIRREKIELDISQNDLKKTMALLELNAKKIYPDRKDSAPFIGICRSGNKEIEFENGIRKSGK